MNIAVVIPGYNEARRIGGVLEDVAKLPQWLSKDIFNIIVVDDGSRDATSKHAREYIEKMPEQVKLHVLRHQTNLGKGSAVQTGCEAAKRLKTDITVLMDGDGQHRAEDVATLIKMVKDQPGPALVIGARKRNRTMPLMMRFGNGLLSSLARGFFNIQVRDSQSGLRAFPTATYAKIRWASSDYAMETEMLIMATASRVKLIEVPIETIYYDRHKGTTPLDGLRIVRTLFEWKFFRSPLRHLAIHDVEDHISKPVI